MRIGFGYDVHKLVPNRKLILGGVTVPFDKGLLGHSDADVLIHAIIDALLGALALGDIGKLFPDSKAQYKDIDSRILLKRVFQIVKENKYRIGNLDSTVCAQEPKLRNFILEMRKNLANDLETNITNISVKATTEEHLGISGSQEGITAHCIVLLTENFDKTE
ncbi:MAG: 2-C-methyl-D-erythritol 2,4-cyclodiphosphate synthase [Candidatus Cloacimonetes bacterium]|nr:2-C-methyl-D-erythritol 2,4-cyclodiphosphate synthase [Candidatus Cloacimonadota bacterium]